MPSFQDYILKVSQLQKERMDAVCVVKNTNTKQYGRNLIYVSDEEKQQRLKKVHDFYDAKIAATYKELNHQLKLVGKEPLTNPYERKDEKK